MAKRRPQLDPQFALLAQFFAKSAVPLPLRDRIMLVPAIDNLDRWVFHYNDANGEPSFWDCPLHPDTSRGFGPTRFADAAHAAYQFLIWLCDEPTPSATVAIEEAILQVATLDDRARIDLVMSPACTKQYGAIPRFSGPHPQPCSFRSVVDMPASSKLDVALDDFCLQGMSLAMTLEALFSLIDAKPPAASVSLADGARHAEALGRTLDELSRR